MIQYASGFVTIPDVSGLSCNGATQKLESYRLSGSCTDTSSTTVASGKVIGTSPQAAGSQVQQGTTLTIQVSSGPGQATVPSIKGLSEANARAAIEANGFRPGRQQVNTCDQTQDGYRHRPVAQRQRAAPAGDDRVLQRGRLQPQRQLHRPADDMSEPRLRVAVLYGGRSSEHQISVESGRSVAAALDPERYELVEIEIAQDGTWQLEAGTGEGGEPLALAPGGAAGAVIPRPGSAPATPGDIGPLDVVLPILHGPFGEDGTVQGLLEMAGLPYIGSGVAGSAVTMDKDLIKPLLASVGIQTARSVTFRARVKHDHEAELAAAEISLPCFVKPARLGSSVGITKVTEHEQLAPALELAFRHDSKVLVEEMVVGREVEVGVLGNDEPVVSLPGEIVIDADWYDFEAKYSPGGMRLDVPADIGAEATEELQRAARVAFARCECAGMARIDFFVTADGRVVLNEINTIPGFTSTSVYARLFEASGVPYSELLDRLIELALERHRDAEQYSY